MKTIIGIALVAMASMGYAQNNANQVNNFTKSYEYEYSLDYPNAIRVLESDYDINSYAMNLRLGWLYYLNADYVKSQSYYNKSISLEPSSIEARLGYVYPTAALENWEDVLNTYKDILGLDPNNMTVNYRVGYIYQTRKDFTKALLFAKKVVAAYPFDFDGNVLIAQIYISLGQITEAKKHYKIALLYNPQSIEVQEALKNL